VAIIFIVDVILTFNLLTLLM